MPIKIDEDDFTPETAYQNETVGQILEEMKPRLKDNIFLLNQIKIDGYDAYTTPEINNHHNTINSHIEHVNMLDDSGKEREDFTVAGVINLETNHYVAAIFRKNTEGIKTLTLYDPLGKPESFSGGFKKYQKPIIESFQKKFGNDIITEVNPKNHAIYQKDVVSCGVLCSYIIEQSINDNKLEANPKLGITKNQSGELECEEGAPLLRQDQLKKLKQFKMIEDFMGDAKTISSEDLVNNIFNNSQYDTTAKNRILNKMMNAGLIEGQTNLSKETILKALDEHAKKTPSSMKPLDRNSYKVKEHDNLTPTPTPTSDIITTKTKSVSKW